MQDILAELGFMEFLKDNGYMHMRPIPDGRYAAIAPFMFSVAIITGRIGDRTGYADRWCYHSAEEAIAALEAWDGTGEPQGWIRHPATGRRRPNGDEEAEYINP